FDDVKISVKASSVPLMIDAYRLLSKTTDHPLHLGVTEAGVVPQGLIKGVAGIATLLAEGIGDTIRFSLTADPVEEAKAGRTLLEAMGLRERKGLDLIACPSCGRAEVDVIRVATDAQAALAARNIPLQVAVMGCVVNGPGEAREADLGIAAGRGKGHLFVKGQVVRVVPESEMVAALIDEAERIMAEGIEARLAAADPNAAAIAEGVPLGSKLQDFLAGHTPKAASFLPIGDHFRFYTVTSGFPKRAPQDYRLTVKGLVQRPFTLTYDELRAMPPTMITKDFQCVTGWRVHNVRWTGVRLSELLDKAGVQPTAKALRFTSFDGVYTESLTIDQARRADVLVAYDLDGKPLSS